MYDGYNKIFWGTLITSFNINLGPINILPNFVGFLLIVSGLNTIYRESSLDMFQKISTLGMLVALLSFIGGTIDFFYQGMSDYFFANIIWTMVFVVLEFVFFFKVLEVSIEYLKQNNHDDTTEVYIYKLRNYTIFTLLNILFLGISSILNLQPYLTISIIIAVFLKVYLLTIIYGLRNIFTNPASNEEE